MSEQRIAGNLTLITVAAQMAVTMEDDAITEMLDEVSYVGTMGPMLDPTGFQRVRGALEINSAMIRAYQTFRDECIRIGVPKLGEAGSVRIKPGGGL